MLDALLSMKCSDYSGAAWGYNFDWQSRNFFAPRGTPTIVPTAFAARALVEAAKALRDNHYLETARSVCDFIKKDLARSYETDSELCFSYSIDSNTQIHNANLLAAEVLAEVGALTHDEQLLKLAERATRFVINRQQQRRIVDLWNGSKAILGRQFSHGVRLILVVSHHQSVSAWNRVSVLIRTGIYILEIKLLPERWLAQVLSRRRLILLMPMQAQVRSSLFLN